MKPTPRTDAESWAHPTDGAEVVDANFARDLERQLSDALEREAKLRQELAVEFGNSDRLAKALQIAIRQNSHDMLLTGEELRKCESALALHESGDEPTTTDCPIHGRHEGDCPRC